MIGNKNLAAAWQMFRSYAVLRPWQTAAIIALFFLASMAESVGILGLLPLLAVFQGTANTAQASGPIGMMLHGLTLVGLEPGLGSALLVIVSAMVCSNGFLALAQAYIAYTTSRLVMEMRVNMIRSLGEARWGYFVEQPVGQIVNVLGPQVQTASTGIIRSLSMAALIVQTIALFAGSLLVSWKVTLAGAFLALLIAATLDRFVSMSRVTGGELIRIQNTMMNTLIDGLQGIKALKAMAREQALVRLLRSDARRMMRAFVRNQLASILLDRLPAILVLMLLGGFIYVAVTMTGAALPEVIVVAAFGYRAMGRISDLQKSLQKIVAIYGAYRLVRNTQERLTDQREHAEGTRPPHFEREIRFERASFSYGNGDVLSGIDLVVPASGLTVLIGPSGAGKSTIVDLVLGLRRATGGRILIDGVPIEQIDVRAWRSMVGYMPQEIRLFDRSIYENVALDEPSVGRADVERALRQAEASEFVDNLPAGIDSAVGQAGLSISGGQRQRIALARALVHRPRLLLLDEATSALDPESERRICATLKHIAADTAILAISHQPRILEIADRAYRIDGGEVRPVTTAIAV